MNKHTPGEWRVRNNSIGGPFVSSDNGTIADVRTFGGVHVGGHQHPETIANARLIAAAPDMLDELLFVLDWAVTERGPLRKQEIESIRAVIAKATGD